MTKLSERPRRQGSIASQEIRIVERRLSSLTLDPRNARRHTKKQIAKLAAVIRRYGFTNPIIIDEHGRIIAGHARHAAAVEIGLEHVPCVQLLRLSEADKIALAIADNRMADLSTFDPDMLAGLLRELEEANYDIEFTGFDTAQIDALFTEEIGRSSAADPADAVELPDDGAVAITQPGDLWLLDGHRLLCGDALTAPSYQALLDADRADMIFTDPPYNVSIPNHASGLGKARHREFAMASGEMTSTAFTNFLTTATGHMAAFSKGGALHYICMDWRHLSELLEAGRASYAELKALCVWDKGSGGMGSLYRSQHELVLVFKNGAAPHVNNVELGKHGRYRTNVWQYPGLNGFGAGRDAALAIHPTVKPVALVADAIRDCSKRGGLILDPFAGSGTILLAAERAGRRAAAIELDPLYVDVAIRRWQSFTGKLATLAEGGVSFGEIAAARTEPERSKS